MNNTPQEMSYGIWPDGRWVTFYSSAKTEWGTINEKDIIGSYGSAEEARLAILRATEGT